MSIGALLAASTVLHVFLQSHLDPVWLWNREQGIDAAIATARTMCDILDDYPETHMTRGEAWIYECCEKYDQKTFARLKAHVAGGRLHVVGSEYVQPDCNFPAGDAMADHLAFAGRYFRDHVGAPQIRTGYNPDSFGHGAYVPRFLREAGMENYLFMRPGFWGNEKTLPGEIFRWRSPDGAEVLAARINGCYNPSSNDDSMYWQITNVVANCDKRIGHCFTMVGVGDHGGGPARAQIDWIIKHRPEWPDVKVIFSHPDAFFDAVRKSGVDLPVVTDELQHHAIGCYTALSRIKREVRATEDALRRDGALLKPEVLDACRGKLYFSTFHDVLGGCSIASAYPDIFESLGYVRNLCHEARIAQTRKRNSALPPAKYQRVIFDNPGKGRWRGVTEFEAWLKSHEGWYSWGDASLNKTIALRDADGRSVPIQVVPHRDKSGRPQPNLAVALDLAPGETRTYYLSYDKTEAERAAEKPLVQQTAAPRYRFEVIEDETDTWSHGVKGYPKATRTMCRVGEGKSLSVGSVVNESICEYADASGRAIVRERNEVGLDGQRLAIRVDWMQPREIVKLAIEPGFAVTGRVDRVPGGDVVRRLDGEEWPFAGAVTLLGARGERFAVVCRDAAALDVQPDGTVRLTLFRTPPYSEHIPSKVNDASCPVTDLGSHTYDVRFIRKATPEQIDDALYSLASPLVFSETTQGVGGSACSNGVSADRHDGLEAKIASVCKVTGTDTWYGHHRIKFDFNGHGAWVVEPSVQPEKGCPWTWTMQWAEAFVKRTGVPAMLGMGYHHVTIDLFDTRMNEKGLADAAAFQKFIVETLGFDAKANLIGMSWGGFFSTRYAATYPANVARIYLDAPLLNFEGFSKVDPDRIGIWRTKPPTDGVWTTDPRMPVNLTQAIAKAKIPILLAYGGQDQTVNPAANSELFIERFKKAGGNITVIPHPLNGHHPHGLDAGDNRIISFLTAKE